MPWTIGGIIGMRNLPSAIAASGVWRLSEIESSSRRGVWPAQPVQSPSEIPGLMLWLDGSDASTLYDATSGGSLVAADGAVARWQDKSGNNRHFTQSTSGVRPLRRVAVKNGLAAVEFTNDWMVGVYTYTVGSMFCVWNHPTTATSDTFPAIVSQRTSGAVRTSNGTLGFGLGVPSSTVANVILDPNPSASGSYRLNGAVAASGYLSFSSGVAVRTSPDRWQYNSSTFPAVAGSKSFVLGGDVNVSSGRTMQNGHIGEIIAYSGTLSASEVASVEGYLVSKWGLS